MAMIQVVKRAKNFALQFTLDDTELKHVFNGAHHDDPHVQYIGNSINGITLKPGVANGERINRKLTVLDKSSRNQIWAARVWLPPEKIGVIEEHRSHFMLKSQLEPDGKLRYPPLQEAWRSPDAHKLATTANGHPMPALISSMAPAPAAEPAPTLAPGPAPPEPVAAPPETKVVAARPGASPEPREYGTETEVEKFAFARVLGLCRELNTSLQRAGDVRMEIETTEDGKQELVVWRRYRRRPK